MHSTTAVPMQALLKLPMTTWLSRSVPDKSHVTFDVDACPCRLRCCLSSAGEAASSGCAWFPGEAGLCALELSSVRVRRTDPGNFRPLRKLRYTTHSSVT